MIEQDCEQLTLFPADSRASRSALPGSEEARRMTVTSGLKCLELYRNSGLLGLLVRMLLGSSIWRSTRCMLTWKTKVTPCKRLLFRLVPSTPRTGGTDVRLWPTPTTDSASQRTKQYKQGGLPLAMAAAMWPTPKATDYKGSGPAGSKSAEHDLKKHNLKGMVMFYPTRRNMSQGNGGQLNPTWVEWLMGFPIGWTDLNASETP